MTRFLFSIVLLITSLHVTAQIDSYNQMDADGNITRVNDQRRNNAKDSTSQDKEVPKGLKVWTVDNRFGDIRQAIPDTLMHMYPNSIFTSGLRGEYNTTGNLGAPRISRLFVDRLRDDEQFIFTQPYDYFIVAPDDYHFTNTSLLLPI